jgi:predicted dehydrogenase
MVGGGPGAGIAETHRTAMRLDDQFVLVAGAFSRDHEKSLTAARQLRVGLDRVYPDYRSMAEVESKSPFQTYTQKWRKPFWRNQKVKRT